MPLTRPANPPLQRISGQQTLEAGVALPALDSEVTIQMRSVRHEEEAADTH